MKKSYTASFKAQVVLELLKETKTLAQLASEHGVAVTVLREWKLDALKGLPDLFERHDSVSELKTSHERELAELYAEIGRLTTQVNFLKKSCPPEPPRASSTGRTPGRRACAQYPGRAALVQSQ